MYLASVLFGVSVIPMAEICAMNLDSSVLTLVGRSLASFGVVIQKAFSSSSSSMSTIPHWIIARILVLVAMSSAKQIASPILAGRNPG